MLALNLYDLFVNQVFGGIVFATVGIGVLFYIMCLLFRMSPMMTMGVLGLYVFMWGMILNPIIAILPTFLAIWYLIKGVSTVIKRYWE